VLVAGALAYFGWGQFHSKTDARPHKVMALIASNAKAFTLGSLAFKA
jgi:hypothetical protein